jgi:hypothetical protein
VRDAIKVVGSGVSENFKGSICQMNRGVKECNIYIIEI